MRKGYPPPVPVYLEAPKRDTRNPIPRLLEMLNRRTLDRASEAERDEFLRSLQRTDWAIRDFLDSAASGRWLTTGAAVPRDRSIFRDLNARGAYLEAVMP